MRKYIYILIIAVIVLAAFAVRFYHFHEWLYFKMDQARDAMLVSNAVKNGAGDLPLLGPRAGATEVSSGYLRLGPAFYYFQYLAGKIFNSTRPDVFAYPDLFFSLLTIPLLYLFLRLYFSRLNSILVTLMYSFSFIVIQYSRFAWNPNSLLFFSLLCFYGMLKFLNSEKTKNKMAWLILWALGLSLGSQLHFLGLFCLSGMSLILILFHYKLWRKSEIVKLKNTAALKKIIIYIFTFLAVFSIIYSPVIISEVMRKGENTKNFIQAFSSKPKDRPLAKKITRSFEKQLKYYCLITTSNCYQGEFSENKASSLFTLALFIFGIAAAVRNLIKSKKDPADTPQKDFMRLVLIWFGMLYLFSIPLYSSLRPRFFIFVFPLPFILLGMIFVYLEEKIGKRAKVISVFLTAAILALNAYGTKAWFGEQAKSQLKGFTIQRTLILKNQDGVTLGQLEKAVNFMYQKRKPGANIYYYVKPEHMAPIKYLFEQKKGPDLKYFSFTINSDPKAQYFAIVPAKNDGKDLKGVFENFVILNQQKFGQIEAYEVEITGRNTSENFESAKEETRSPDRLFWKDIFKSGNQDIPAVIEENSNNDEENDNE